MTGTPRAPCLMRQGGSEKAARKHDGRRLAASSCRCSPLGVLAAKPRLLANANRPAECRSARVGSRRRNESLYAGNPSETVRYGNVTADAPWLRIPRDIAYSPEAPEQKSRLRHGAATRRIPCDTKTAPRTRPYEPDGDPVPSACWFPHWESSQPSRFPHARTGCFHQEGA